MIQASLSINPGGWFLLIGSLAICIGVPLVGWLLSRRSPPVQEQREFKQAATDINQLYERARRELWGP